MNDLLHKKIRYRDPESSNSNKELQGEVTEYSANGTQLKINGKWIVCGSLHVLEILEGGKEAPQNTATLPSGVVPQPPSPGPNPPHPATPHPDGRRVSNPPDVAAETRAAHARKSPGPVPGAAGPGEFQK